MSVIVYEYDEFEGVAITLSKIKALEPVVMSNSYVKEYNSRQMPISFKYTMESVIGRLLWYMYVANRVAYSLQYQENLKIFEDELPAKKFTDTEAADKFGSFMYNIYTNNGTVFLSKEWLGLAKDIEEALKFLNITSRYAKGGVTKGQTLAENFNLNDKVKNVEFWNNDVIVQDKEGKVKRIDLDKGERISLNAKGGKIAFESGDVVTYEGEDHTVQRIEDDELGVRIYIRPNEKSYYGGRKDTFWVKSEDLE
tara:strand:- start:4367 stop:5125 length:759 start_codon:yes stop_codon:yes gene_type:complete